LSYREAVSSEGNLDQGEESQGQIESQEIHQYPSAYYFAWFACIHHEGCLCVCVYVCVGGRGEGIMVMVKLSLPDGVQCQVRSLPKD